MTLSAQRRAGAFVAAIATAVLLAPAAAQADPPGLGAYQEDDGLGFRNIVPPGSDGVVSEGEMVELPLQRRPSAAQQRPARRVRRPRPGRATISPSASTRSSRTPASVSRAATSTTSTRRTARRRRLPRRVRSTATTSRSPRDEHTASRTSTAPTAPPPCSARATSAPRTGSSSWTSNGTSVAPRCRSSSARRTSGPIAPTGARAVYGGRA